VRFSFWLTNILHRFEGAPIERRLQLAELDYLASSPAGRAMIAENYVGLAFEPFE
jgi:p-hydroxybenzoate 3-monooxygenase